VATAAREVRPAARAEPGVPVRAALAGPAPTVLMAPTADVHGDRRPQLFIVPKTLVANPSRLQRELRPELGRHLSNLTRRETPDSAGALHA
jgi:hypothetical protein